MSKEHQGKYKTFVKHGREYLNSRYDLLKLELLEKMSSIVALLIAVMIALVLAGSVWIYISCILIVWLEGLVGGYIPAFLIMGGFNLLLLLIIFLFKDRLILNPIIRQFGTILYDDPVVENEEEEEEENGEQENI